MHLPAEQDENEPPVTGWTDTDGNGIRASSEEEEVDPGIYMAVNDDFDSGGEDPDCEDSVVAGTAEQIAADLRDMAKVSVSMPDWSRLPPDSSIVMSVDDTAPLRVFWLEPVDSDADGTAEYYILTPIIGNGSADTWRCQRRQLCTDDGDPVFYVEGAEPGSTGLHAGFAPPGPPPSAPPDYCMARITDATGATEPVGKDRSKLSELKMELTADLNNDGSITVVDDLVEEDSPGKLIAVNDDNDNSDDDNGDGDIDGDDRDYDDALWDGDGADTAELILRLDPDGLPGTHTVELSVSDASKVRIFDASNTSIIGPTTAASASPVSAWDSPLSAVSLPNSDLTFHVEGVEHGGVTITLKYKTDTGVEIRSDRVKVGILKMELFRDEACTMILDDWPADGDQLRSPKYVFGAEDNIYIQTEGPPGLGDSYFKVQVTNADSGGTAEINLHEVSTGTYRNYEGEWLRLAENSGLGSPADHIEVQDEEILAFVLEGNGTSLPASRTVMVDRGEYAMATQKPENFYGLWYDVAQDFEPPLRDYFKWWKNGDQKGPSEDYIRSAGDSNECDIFSIAGHGLPEEGVEAYSFIKLNGSDFAQGEDGFGIAAHEDAGGTAGGYMFDGAAWQPVLPALWQGGIEDAWGKDVDWVILSSCSLLRDDMPAAPVLNDMLFNRNVWDDTLFGNRPAHGLFGYSSSPLIKDLDETVTSFFNQVKTGSTLVDAWMAAVLAETGADYGIVMHAANANDRLTEPTADTQSTAMRYWHSVGQAVQDAVNYTDIGAGENTEGKAQQVVVRVDCQLSDERPPAKYLLARSPAPDVSEKAKWIEANGVWVLFCGQEQPVPGESLRLPVTEFASRLDSSLRQEGGGATLYEDSFEANSLENRTREVVGHVAQFTCHRPAFPIAWNRRGRFVKLVSDSSGMVRIAIARLMEPIRYVDAEELLVSEKDAVGKVVGVLRSNRIRVGNWAKVTSVTLEYEDPAPRAPGAVRVLHPVWRVNVSGRSCKRMVYVSALPQG